MEELITDSPIGKDTVSQDSKRERYFDEFDYGIDVQDNVIYFDGDIQAGLTFDLIAKTRLLKKLNPNLSEINIMLNSGGGDVLEGLALIDFMRDMETKGIKFNIIVRGIAMSMGAIILAAGTGKRMASKHSKIMVHQISTIVGGKLSDVKSNARFSEELEDECNQILSDSTNQPKDYWANIQSSDYFMSAERALELGIIDKII